MDRNDLPAEDLFQNYRELHNINRWLGGYRITLKGLSKLITDLDRVYSILDVGCGGGDMINEIDKWSQINNFRFHLSGLDKSEAAIHYAGKNKKIEWISDDVFDHLNSERKYDIITCTLFMHHFPNEKIKELLQSMMRSANVGIVINDLERNPIAYYSIGLLTKLFSKSYLVKNDAPLSVLRGFKKPEWRKIVDDAGLQFSVFSWQWAFRHLLVIKK